VPNEKLPPLFGENLVNLKIGVPQLDRFLLRNLASILEKELFELDFCLDQ
jgi:hypothetical protein